jgi:acyl transferase domain-containing protein
VAIVGMACLFPKAPDVATFWENIVRKVDAVSDPPPSRGMEPFLETREETGLYCVRGGYIGDLAKFHPLDFGIMPSSVDGAEPDQFLALEVAHQTLLDAGVPDLPLNRERTEVILGRGTFTNRGVLIQFQHKIAIDQFLRLLRELHPEHSEEELRAIRARLSQCVPPITPETPPGWRRASPGRTPIASIPRREPHDGACASSLIAMEKALQDLRDHRCDAALVGGVQVSTPAPIHNMFADMGALSRKPHLRPFDREADGTMLGEGAGMLLLKRLEDAERTATGCTPLLRGTSSDGRARAILTPRVEGEELALRRAYDAEGIDPATVGLIEAHGTAMPVGDETEIQALRRVFGELRGAPRIALGSVKSMISHLLPASGAAGTIKAALALYHKVLPPTIHLENPTPSSASIARPSTSTPSRAPGSTPPPSRVARA